MKNTLSPLRYPGGKTCYYPLISEIIDINDLEGCIYAEPFAGGAGAALSLLSTKKVSKILLNDIDLAIYAFWFSILSYTNQFISKIIELPICVEEWQRQKAIYKNEKDDLLKLGFATFYLNRCNVAGIMLANPIGGIAQSGKYKIDARFNKEKLIKKIEYIATLKDKIRITNLDAIKFIKNLRYRKQKLFIYFDPPYYKKGKLLYYNHYEHEDHLLLKNCILDSKYPWLLSYDSNKAIADLYANKPIYCKSLSYSINGSSIGNEYLISDLIMPSYLQRGKTI